MQSVSLFLPDPNRDPDAVNCTHKNGQEEKEESKKQDKSGF